jgi:hypothetical protein
VLVGNDTPEPPDKPFFLLDLQELRGALEEKGIKVAVQRWPPPVVYVRFEDNTEKMLTEATQRAQKELGSPAEILFVIQEKSEYPR